MKRTLLIDGDTLIFAASSGTETEVQFDAWTWVLWGNLDKAISHFQQDMARIEDALSPDEVIVALSDDLRFRPQVMPTYKSNRQNSRKPCTYRPLREWVRENYRTYQKPYLEGDDVLGILATHPKVVEGEKVIVAIDKDLNTIPGLHYNYANEDLYEVSPAEADRFFFKQCLMGDPTDGYPGCRGIGPKKADALLDMIPPNVDGGIHEPFVWAMIVDTYQKAGLTEEDALQNARVARICRHTDYDFKKNEVILWTPTLA